MEYSSRTPWEKEVDLLHPILNSNCKNDEPETSKSQVSAYRGFSANTEGNISCSAITFVCNHVITVSYCYSRIQLSMKFTVARMTSLKPRTFIKQMNIFIKKHKVKEGLAFSTISAQLLH